MLKVLRTEKGASILDLDNLVKVNVEEDAVFDSKSGYGQSDCYKIEFDTRLHDLLRGGGSTWFAKSLDVAKQTDPDLAEILGNLFRRGRAHILQNGLANRNNDEDIKHQAQFRRLYDDCEEIIYFSEERGIQVPKLELMSVEDRGYSLSFRKATFGLAKLDFFIKRNNGRDPELARFYSECFSQIIEIAGSDYEDYNDEMMENFIDKYKQKTRKKEFSIKRNH